MPPVNLIDPATGETFAAADEAEAASLESSGWRREGGAEAASRITEEQREEEYTGAANKVRAGIAAGARGITLGGSDVLASAAGYGEEVRNLRDYNPGISIAGEVVGSLSGAGLAGRAAQLGKRIATVGEGATFATKAARAGAGYGTEGALQGLGSGISELALSDDPLTIERVGSVLSSNVLLGGAVGGGAGILGKVAEKGLVRAKGLLDDAATKLSSRGDEVAGDVAQMDAKGLRAARDAEMDALEAARVPQRAQVANEIAAFRKELKEQKLWLATNKSGVEGLESVGKRTLKADKALDNLLDDPKALANEPKAALRHLRVQEAAYQDVLNKSDELKKTFAADTSGARAATLDKVPAMLERNRAIQAKLTELSAAPKSARLAEIEAAKEALSSGAAQGGRSGIAQQMVQGTAFGAATGAISAIPVIGQIPGLAPLLGAKAASMLGDLVTGRLGKASAEVAARTSKAVDTFLTVGGKLAPAAPVLATKVLNSVRYGRESEAKRAAAKSDLASAYKARASEIRSQTAPGPTGKPVMRPEARLKMAGSLDPVRTLSPMLADRLETLAARRLEFLADKLPKRPELDTIPIGPDNWQPSEMEMRKFARYAAAVEDPGGIEERLASGQVTPEDAEVMKTVYPERYANIVGQIVERLPELRGTLPYARRLALSIFSGIPVDAAMNPRILGVLQQTYTTEEGSEQGTQAPKPKPAFGSVKSQDATPSQERQGATT